MTRLLSAQSCRRWIAGFLAVMIGLGPMATPAFAQLTALADQPLNAQNKAQPNIMLTVDDSTSMLFDFLPDSVIQGYCRDITGKMTANCGFVGQNTALGGGRGKYVTPGYIFEQAGLPYSAFDPQYDGSGPGAGCFTGKKCSISHNFCSTVAPIVNCGVGEGTCTSAPTCSAGIAPGPLPGIEQYPAGNSPLAGQEYEYWTLWPAPVHNSAFNHIYYNPKLTYIPPVYSNGGSYPQMTDWKHVPADPFNAASPKIDLTTPVTVGIWCNSDWSIGHENDPAFCRTNGTGPSAATSNAATPDGDYNYPWAPPSIAPGLGPTTAQSIAWSKVDKNTNAILAAWATAKDTKYYFQNDNVLWCNPNAAGFPHTGPVVPQACDNPPPSDTPQSCVGFTTQTCGGGTPVDCLGIHSQSCIDHPQQCGPLGHQDCTNGITAHCGNPQPQSCISGDTQTCDSGHQTCSGAADPTCNGVAPQTCSAYIPTCNSTPNTCLPPTNCSDVWDPPGCDTCRPGECGDCRLTTSCDPRQCSNTADTCDTNPCPLTSYCSDDHSDCTLSGACPKRSGTCSGPPFNSCMDASSCDTTGSCTNNGATCHSPLRIGECPHVDGQCSGPDHEACATNGSGVCADIDTCSIDVGTKCTAPGTYDPAECPDKMGHCSLAISPPEACVNGSHTCLDLGVCDGTVNQQCHGDGDCHDVPGGCAGDGQSCNFALNNCPDVGTCTLDGNHCHSSGINLLECPDLDGTCDSEGQRCNNTLGPACPMTTGHCGGPGGAVCTDSPNTCPNNGMTCQGGPTHNPCTTATAATDCPTLGGSCDGGYGTCNFGTDPPSCPFIHNHGMCHDGINRCDKPDGSDCPQISTSGPVACSDLVLGSTTMSIPVPNGDFEAPLVDTSTHDYSFDFTGAAWSSLGGAFFVRRPAVTRPGVDVDVPIGIQGAQAVGIQGVPPGGSPGSIYQAINIPAGSYRLSFLAAQRDCCDPGPNPVIVSVDGVPLGSPITPTPDFNVNSYSVQFAIANGGGPLHTIAFTGTVGGDRSTFIDAVTITSGKSLLEDANSDGAVCRHNNQNYADGTTAVRFNYPDATYNLPVFAGTGPNACVPSPRYTTVARHYWKTSVEWCIDFEGHDDAKWQGYGSTRCQDDQDETHIYPRFYQFDQPAGTDNVATPAMQRMDLDATVNPTFDHGLDELGDPIHRNFGGGTPDVSEMVNYANWFAYYRTRILAVKTVTSLSFNELDGKSRVGLHTMFADLMPVHPNPIVYPTFLNVAQFDNSTAAQLRDLWFNTMFGITVPLGHETPTLDSMVRIGQYYMTGHSTGLPTAADPIVLSCSKNFHLLFTDGYTNQQGIPTEIPPVNDQDNTITTYPNIGAHPIPGLVAGGAWPHPYQEDVVHGPADNSLSDYAMYYWVTDLYHGSGGPNRFNVVASDSDPATWLHQNFAAVSLGTTGKLAAGSATESGLAAGTVQWPQPQDSLGHVNVFQPDNSGVDDLWHAAVNGRGQFVNAQSVDELKLGIGQVLADVAAQSGARIGAGFQSVNYSLAGGTNVYYRVTFEPGWAGSLTKVVYDPNLPPATAVEQWKAETQLTAKLLVVNPGDTPWLTNRRIVTVNESGTAVPFLWANLGAHQQDSLWPPAVFSKVQREKWVVDYLRGDSEREGSKLGQFRKRSGPLGDIVDSSPVYVGPKPNAPYRDTDDPGYSAFAASTTRGARVYVAANDGMVHAFDDGNGNETWAYIPSQLYRGGTAGGDKKAGLAALAYQTGALPPFSHHYLVDGPIKIGDVNFGAASWHTIAVGGLGKGGTMYYGLDVTQPADITDEASAASKVLWEFTDPNMGYTYGKPMLAKVRAYPDGWVVIVGSGYNNVSGTDAGVGKLFIFDAKTGGTLFKQTLTTGVGSGTTPSGLAHPAGYTKDFRNQTVEQIYAGDLLGNFWRFDVSGDHTVDWKVELMAQLVDPAGHAQPVTTPPQIEIDVSNGIDRWVFVGTGKLYDDSDETDLQQQTMYAFRDGTADTQGPIVVGSPVDRFDPGMKKLSQTSTDNFGLGSKPDKGWFDDLPTGAVNGQRIIVPPQAALSIVAYVGTSPQTDSCLTGEVGNVYVRDFSTGQSLLTESDGVTVERSEAIGEGAVGLEIVGLDTASGTSVPDIRVAVTLGTTGAVKFIKPKIPALTAGHRMSWRLLGQ